MAADQGLLDFLREYVDELAELTTPIKSRINSLSMLAAEEAAAAPAAAPSIAAAIEKRISTAPPAAKLPALFLLDSISKNAKEPFVQIFSRNLPQVFTTVWDACPTDRTTLQRVLTTWDRIFPPPALDAIRRRCGLVPTLATQPGSRQLPGAVVPGPMQQPQQLSAQAGYTPPQPDPLQGAGSARAAPDPYAGLRAAAAARLAQLQPRQHHVARGHTSGVGAPLGIHPGGGRGREYQPHLAGLPRAEGGGVQLPPQQFAELQALLQSLAQGTNGAAATPALPNGPVDELWSQTALKERHEGVIKALLIASEGTRAGQLDRAFAAKRRSRARGGTQQSRRWWPSASAWLRGKAVDIDPATAFGQQEAEAEQAAEAESVPADDTQTQCALSGEKFETFWGEEQQQWRYRDARRLSAAEAARYKLPEGVIVLVSALGSPRAEGHDAHEQAAEAASITSDSSPAVQAAAAEDCKAGILEPSAAAAGTGLAPPVKDEEPQGQQVGRVGTGDSADAVAEMAPAAVETAAVTSEQENAATMRISDAITGTKRQLGDNTGQDGPPLVKVKREQQ